MCSLFLDISFLNHAIMISCMQSCNHAIISFLNHAIFSQSCNLFSIMQSLQSWTKLLRHFTKFPLIQGTLPPPSPISMFFFFHKDKLYYQQTNNYNYAYSTTTNARYCFNVVNVAMWSKQSRVNCKPQETTLNFTRFKSRHS